MRQFLVALLLPAALAACGGSGGAAESAATEAEAPAAEPAVAEAQPAAAPAPVQTATVAGTWTNEAINGRQGVSYVTEDGGSVVSFACLRGEEGGPNSLFVRTNAPAGPATSQIDIFGGGGSGTVPVTSGSTEGGLISGEFDPSSPLGQSLATGLGDLRIRTGDTETVIPNSEQVEAVVEACWPSLEERIAAINAEKEAAAAKAAAELEEEQQKALQALEPDAT